MGCGLGWVKFRWEGGVWFRMGGGFGLGWEGYSMGGG
jgi:hypothetical protein